MAKKKRDEGKHIEVTDLIDEFEWEKESEEIEREIEDIDKKLEEIRGDDSNISKE